MQALCQLSYAPIDSQQPYTKLCLVAGTGVENYASHNCYLQFMKLKWYSVPPTREADTLIRTEIK